MLSERLRSLWDPCFFFRPDLLGRALIRKGCVRPESAIVRTAWGDRLRVDPQKFIGAYLYMRGVHELLVCETLFRLAELNETCVDIGANIGAMTSVLSLKVGSNGRVISFEPHPELFGKLTENVQLMDRAGIVPVNAAVSSSSGDFLLVEGPAFGSNDGTASVRSKADGFSIRVRSVALDDFLSGQRCGVWKVDVEGHENEVFAGAKEQLDGAMVRDVVFETTSAFPGEAHLFLLKRGYTIFRLEQRFIGPSLVQPDAPYSGNEALLSYLATSNPERAARLLSNSGWHLLRSRR
jgi:FkbM family methyltransferase